MRSFLSLRILPAVVVVAGLAWFLPATAQTPRNALTSERKLWQTPWLEITPEIRAQLNILSDVLAQVNRESFLCLTGARRDDDEWVEDGIFVPEHVYSTPTRVFVLIKQCPENTIAWWHNHPNSWPFLSEIDIHSARENQLPFAVLSFGHRKISWWSLDQIHRFKRLSHDDGISNEGLGASPGQIISDE